MHREHGGPEWLTKRPLDCLRQRAQFAAIVAALARCNAGRTYRTFRQFGDLPGGWVLLDIAQRHREAFLTADDYARQCEREFVQAWLGVSE